MTSFSKQVADHIRRYERRINATAKEAVQETVEDAQTPRGRGGRMPVVTGFLRGSLVGSVGSMPSGPTKPDSDKPTISGDGIAAALLRWNPVKGESIFVGWSAVYARPMEYRYGFMRGAADKWPDTVDRVARKVRARI